MRVKLGIFCDPCEDIVRSYLSRELRKFPDVVIVEDSPDYELRVMVLETRNQAQDLVGYAMAVLLLDRSIGVAAVKQLETLAVWVQEDSKKWFLLGLSSTTQVLPALAYVEDLGLQAFPPDALEAQCRAVIARFDGSLLEKHRIRTH